MDANPASNAAIASRAPEPLPPDEPGFVAVPNPEPVHRIASFVSADPAGRRLRLAFWKRPADAGASGVVIVARTWFGPDAEGPPGHAHGGAIAAVLDEVMGVAVWESGYRVVSASLDIRFHAPVPLGTDTAVRAELTEVDGRRVRVHGAIRGPDNILYASARGLFVEVDDAMFRKLMARG